MTTTKKEARVTNTPKRKGNDSMAIASSRCRAVQIDDLRFRVREFGKADVFVELEADPAAWTCSECGTFRLADRSSGLITCPHTMAATRGMSRETVQRVVEIVAPTKPPTGSRGDGISPADVERALAESLARGADARALRAAEHDSEFQPVVGEVVVRTMTDVDRRKLEEARARKAKTYSEPERIKRFTG